MHYNYKDMELKYDRAAIEDWLKSQVKDQEMVETLAMLENLKVLEQWCAANKEESFFQYFQDSVIGARSRTLHYKEKVWAAKEDYKQAEGANKKSFCDWLVDVITAGAPVIVPGLAVGLNYVKIVEIDMMQFLAAVAVGAVFSVPVGIIKKRNANRDEAERARRAEEAKHKYDETWVRHSLCDSRLRLALSKFATTQQPAKADFDRLVESTFEILEQNLDQFALNMCPNGMAPRED